MSYPEYQYPASERLRTKWWEPDASNPQDEMDRAAALVSETASIEMRQSTWHETNLWNASLFTNRELVGFRWGTVEAHGELIPKDLRTENLVEEIGEAMLAKASSSPLKPTPVPHGKSYKVERAVRKLDWFISSLWRHVKGEEAAVQAFLDSYISGLGCVRVDWDPASKTLGCESVFFDNVIIDNRECANRQLPRHYRIRQVAPRSAVEAKYGVDLGAEKQKQYVDYRAVADGWVVLVEAWRLPGPDGSGGRHTVACAGKLLVDVEWKYNWHPLVFFHWRDPVSGFFPRSGVELLVPYQIRLNSLNDAIEESQDIACRPRLLHHTGSGIDVAQWDNEAGRILGYSGSKPEPMVWPTNLSELYNERERVRSAAHNYMGLSLMTSQADMPEQVRLDSSAGVREFRNMEDARHLRLWTRFEAFRLEIAKRMLLVLGAGEGSIGYTVSSHPGGGRGGMADISYDDVRTLTDDNFSWTMDATPLSQLSPAVRRELVRDWASRGLLQPGEERRMEGNTNLERVEDLEMASYDDIYRHMAILEEGDYQAPGPLTNLTYGIPRITQNYHRLMDYEDVEPEVLDNHQRWVLAATAIQQAATQPPPGQMTPFAATQGMPGTNAALPGSPQ